MRLTIPCLVLAAAACSGDDGAASDTTIAGDWFTCKTPACASLDDDDGMRLLPDGTMTGIRASEKALDDDPLCVEVEDSYGVYEIDGDRLMMVGDDSALTVRFERDGDRMTFHFGLGPTDGGATDVQVSMIRVPTYDAEDCGGDPE